LILNLFNILARKRIQVNDNVPNYVELSSLLDDLKDKFNLKSKDVVSLLEKQLKNGLKKVRVVINQEHIINMSMVKIETFIFIQLKIKKK